MEGQIKINRNQRLSDFPNGSLSHATAIELRWIHNFAFEGRTSCHVPCGSPFMGGFMPIISSQMNCRASLSQVGICRLSPTSGSRLVRRSALQARHSLYPKHTSSVRHVLALQGHRGCFWVVILERGALCGGIWAAAGRGGWGQPGVSSTAETWTQPCETGCRAGGSGGSKRGSPAWRGKGRYQKGSKY